jgi:hypothetical protein
LSLFFISGDLVSRASASSSNRGPIILFVHCKKKE